MSPIYKCISPLLTLTLLLTGCGSVWADARPIDELVQVETVGLDPDETGVALSICAASPKTRETAAGRSIRLAMDAMQQRTGSAALFYAHAKFLLLGPEADIPAALDFMARSSDMRLRTPAVLLKNVSAAEAIRLGDGKTDVTAMLSALQEDMNLHGRGHVFTCGEVLRSLSETGCGLLAAAERRDGTLREAGYGILKDGTCVGWIGQKDAAAVNLLLSLGGHGDLLLPEGVTVTIAQSRCKRSAGRIELTLRAMLSENDAGLSVTDDDARRALEEALCRAVLAQTRSVLEQSRELGADVFGVGDGDVRVNVRAVITRSYDLVDPVNLTGAKR